MLGAIKLVLGSRSRSRARNGRFEDENENARRARLPLAAVVLLVVSFLTASRALAGEPGKPDGMASLEAKFEAGTSGGSALVVRGSAKKLPDQTRLIVKLLVKGQKVEIGYWQANVGAGAFGATIDLEGKEAGPLVYRVELWLMLPKQLDPVKRRLQRDLGVPDTHEEVLDSQELLVGEAAAQKAFRRETLQLFEDVLKKAEAEYAKIEAAIGKTPDDWDKQVEKINERLGALQEATNARRDKYVTLGEMEDLGLAQRVVEDAASAVAAVGKDEHEANRWLASARERATRLKADLEARLPGLKRDAPAKDSKDPKGDTPKDDAPKDDAPKADAPKADAPTAEKNAPKDGGG